MTTHCEISIQAFTKNLLHIKTIVGSKIEVMPVLKADGYGHGSYELAKAAIKTCGSSIIAVGTPEEALTLRGKGIKIPLLTLDGISFGFEKDCITHNITSVVSNYEQLERFSQYAKKLKKKASIHIKVDTGMGRLGIKLEELDNFFSQAYTNKNICIKGLMTHFASAGCPFVPFTEQQIDKFNTSISQLTKKGFTIPVIHAANSGSILYYKNSYFDMVRPGIILYGCFPDNSVASKYQFNPVMQLKTKVIHITMVKKGESISYNNTFTAKNDTLIAIIPAGYAYGYSRQLSNKVYALIKGKRVPQRGTICMNLSAIDITTIKDVKIGDEVVLIGKQGKEFISIDEIAQKIGTISYELMCMIGKSNIRVYT